MRLIVKRNVVLLLLFIACVVSFGSPVVAEQEIKEYSADKIMDMIKKGEDVSIENAVINGTLDFTTLNRAGPPNITSEIRVNSIISIVNSEIHGNVNAYTVNPSTKIVFDKTLNFTGTEILGYSSFYKAKFSSEACFSETQFSGTTSFENAEFHGYAKFSEAKFIQSANFERTWFSGTTSFENAEFHGYAKFVEAIFTQSANFGTTQFSEPAYFSLAEFYKLAFFTEAKFIKNAHFYGTKFSEKAYFESVVFHGDSEFWRTQFFGETYFEGTQFSGETNFRSAEFHGIVNFPETRFSKNAYFQRTRFSGDTDFERAKFTGEINFNHAEFRGRVDFPETHFSELALFTHSKFLNETNFLKVQFFGRASFSWSRFNESVLFMQAHFYELAEFVSIKFHKSVYFYDVIFEKRVSFAASEFYDDSYFTGTEFSGITLFTKANFTGSAFFERTNFKSVADFRDTNFIIIDFSGLPSAYFQDKADFRRSVIDIAKLNGARFTQVDFSGASFGTQLNLEDTDYSNLKLNWEEVAHAIEPKGDPEVFRNLEENFKNQKRLDCANGAFYQRKIAERQKKTSLMQYLEIIFWDWTCGYGVHLQNAVTVSTILILLFSLAYLPRGATIRSPPTEQRRKPTLRLTELPLTSSQQEKKWQKINESRSQNGRFWQALGFSFTVFTKIGFWDTYGTSRVKRFLIIEWFLGLVMILLLFYTLSKTVPFLYTLLKGVI